MNNKQIAMISLCAALLCAGCSLTPEAKDKLGLLPDGPSESASYDYENNRMSQGHRYIEDHVLRVPREVAGNDSGNTYRDSQIILCLRDDACKKHLGSYIKSYGDSIVSTEGSSLAFYSDGTVRDVGNNAWLTHRIKVLASLDEGKQQHYIDFKNNKDVEIERSRKVEKDLNL